VNNLITGCVQGLREEARDHQASATARAAGQETEDSARYSHDVIYPDSRKASDHDSETTEIVTGIDKQKVGQVARKSRRMPAAEPYRQGREVRRRRNY